MRDNAPFHSEQEFQLEESQFRQANAPDPRVGLVRPEAVAQALARYGCAGNEEPMDRKAGNVECRIQGT